MMSKYSNEYLSVNEALKRIDRLELTELKAEKIFASKSVNRVLSEEVYAQRDIPRFNNSAMDGYLFQTQDLKSGIRSFEKDGEIRPEDDPAAIYEPEPKTCKQIMTGAPVPEGDLTVIPVELIDEHESEIEVRKVPERNPIRKQGEGYKKGKPVLPSGTLIRPYELGLMIESGNRECSVKRKIQVAVQVTGSEIDEDMDSNGPVLEGLMQHWPGCDVKRWPVLEDDPEIVLKRMKDLESSADIVLTTGGISMGKHDYILEAMEKLGAEIIVRKVQQKPGKPLTISRLNETIFFHLPGNPISAVFSAECYARRFIYKRLNIKQSERRAITINALGNHRGEKTLFVPGKLGLDDQNRMTVTGESVMKSHLLQLYRDCDAYIRLEPESEYSPGDLVEVIPFSTTNLP